MAAAQPLRISIIPRPHKAQVQPNTQSTNHALHSKPPETFRGSISVRSLTPSTKETHNPKNEKKNVDNLSNNFDKIPIKYDFVFYRIRIVHFVCIELEKLQAQKRLESLLELLLQ